MTSNNLALRARLIDNPTAPSSLNGRGRDAFTAYLDSGPNKAFAIGGGSHFGWATGRQTTDQAVKDALGLCVPGSAAKCTVININNKPVE